MVLGVSGDLRHDIWPCREIQNAVRAHVVNRKSGEKVDMKNGKTLAIFWKCRMCRLEKDLRRTFVLDSGRRIRRTEA